MSCLTAFLQGFSADWAVMISAKIGVVLLLPSAVVAHCTDMLTCFSNSMMIVVVLIFSPPAVTRIGSSSSCSVLTVPSVGSRDRALAAWCLIPARFTMSMSNSDSQGRHQASFPVAFAKSKIHRSEEWSVWIVSPVSWTYGRRRNIHLMIANYSFWSVLKACTAFVNERDF